MFMPPNEFKVETTVEADMVTSISLEFVQARHDVIEAFATLEQSIRTAAKRYGAKPVSECASLGQRLDKLGELKPSSKLSKSIHKGLAEQLDAIRPLVPVRNDIVHSHQQIVELDQAVSIYVNVANSDDAYPKVRMLTLAQHHTLVSEVCRHVEGLNPPSRPQPSPGAAGGL
jgi:hypothetical protein